MSYLPAPVEQLHKRNIEFKYLGYYKKWVHRRRITTR